MRPLQKMRTWWRGLERKEVTLQPSVTAVAHAGYSGEVVTPSSAMALSAVWACTNLVAGTIASLPFEVHRKAGRLTAVDPSHPLHGIIYDSPNYDQTALDFWEFLNFSLELRGNAYAQVERNQAGRVVALYPIHPDAVSVRRTEAGALEYRWTREGRSYQGADRAVLHVRGPGGDPLGGMSTLQVGYQAFASAQAADRAAASTFANGLRPSGVLKFKEWLTDEQRELVEEKLPSRYMGAVNAGRPFIAEGGVEYQSLSISPEDAQMLETRQFSVEEICRFFGVPPVMIGHPGSATAWPTSVEQQGLLFQRFTLRRRVKRIEQAVAKQLMTPAERAAGYSVRFNMEALLRGDSAARSAFYGSMTQMGAMTINEVRERENLAPVPGGDVPRMQMQNVPITEAGKNNGTQ
ncbi:phage portal protein [Rhodobacter sp. NSM]|uniref:phage portal protein n=1 Tax=Rhodobacter sp. NSM TaxID=3457501 RepID=UPI003FD42802